MRNGNLQWVFKTIPEATAFGGDSWPQTGREKFGGANSWAGFALDLERGLVFAPTGSATFDFYGADRAGDNLFANSLLALDAKTGQRVWHYQFVHHDLWDRDLPAPPNLITVNRNGSSIPAVAQATKTGHVFVFHRETGEPLFPIRQEPVIGPALPGEHPANSQPLPTIPPAFAKQLFEPSDRTPAIQKSITDQMSSMRHGKLFMAPGSAKTILYPGMDGGAEWGGLAYDKNSSQLFVNSNQVPYILQMVEMPPGEEARSLSGAYAMMCSGCHGMDRAGDGSTIPSLLDVVERLGWWETYKVIRDGRGRMPGFKAMFPWYATAGLVFHLNSEPAKHTAEIQSGKAMAAAQGNFINAGWQKFTDLDGLPASKPPWGTLTAIGMDSGLINWRIPLGDYPQILEQGLSGFGSENYGGPVVTAGGLLFIAATPDKLFRAFDKDSGELLWSTALPAAGFSTPAVYAVNGKQFIVIAAGGGKLGQVSGSHYLAFALPDKL